MKNKVQNVLASFFLLASALLLFTNHKNIVNESKKVRVVKTIDTGNTITVIRDKIEATIAITDALNNYTPEKMEKIIRATYDEKVLNEKTPSHIMNEMSNLLNNLKGAKLYKIIAESPDKVTVKMVTNDSDYFLEIFFYERTQKIKKMDFARIK